MNYKKELRDLKLRIINDEFSFNFDIDVIEKSKTNKSLIDFVPYASVFKKRYHYEVDFFEEIIENTYDILEYNVKKLKIHNPIEIISHKMGMDSFKHSRDLIFFEI